MKRDILFITISCLLTFLGLFALLKSQAPSLFETSTPIDLQLVQVDEKVPPFFEGVFRSADFATEEMILRDPYLMRARPLFPDRIQLGPHDLLGFRNRGVPNQADVVTIGDSQTYGINATLETSWPGQLGTALAGTGATVYNMSVGGWGPAEYYGIFDKALHLKPQLIIVAIYSGNDPLNAFVRVKGQEHWRDLAPEEDLGLVQAPRVAWPPPKSDLWKVSFADGWRTVFTPRLRYHSHTSTPAARLGHEITANMVRLLGAKAEAAGVELIFTAIPTKELSLLPRLQGEGIEARQDYSDLVQAEERNLRILERRMGQVEGAQYVEVLGPLQRAAAERNDIYPQSSDGHPLRAGYGVITQTLLKVVRPLLLPLPEGLLLARVDKGGGRTRRQILWVRDGEAWLFASGSIARENGWNLKQVVEVEPRRVLNLRRRAWIDTVDPDRFGPQGSALSH
jgi:lysophospholipase L1-like esterase